MLREISVSISFIFLTASCSGGGEISARPEDGQISEPAPEINLGSYSGIDEFGRWTAESLLASPLVTPQSLPATGTSLYSGAIFFTLVSEMDGEAMAHSVAGGIDINANFSNDRISGEAGSFLTSSNEAVIGELEVVEGPIDRSSDTDFDFTFQLDVAGNLEFSDIGNLSFDGSVAGDFYGQNDGIVGIVIGEASSSVTPYDISDGLILLLAD